MSTPDRLPGELDDLLAAAQAEERMPAVAACVFRDGDVVWQRALGLADVEAGEEATVEHAFRIGSITKTFTAVCVMQLREEGLVDLDAPLRTFVPEAPVGPTVRQALAHLTGLQREVPGNIWETLVMPTREDVLERLEDSERVLRPMQRFHYSNLVFSLLGELLVRRSGLPYSELLRERVLAPLALDSTGLTPVGRRACGYHVPPWSDAAVREADVEIPEPPAAMGQLWSTVGDLARYGTFLAEGHDDVLPKAVLDEMAVVQTIVDPETWTIGWGLGLTLVRSGDRVFAAHGGAMPGFLAWALVHRAESTGAVVLTNSGAGPQPDRLGLRLAEAALDAYSRAPAPWRPAPLPDELRPLLGSWWTEGHEAVVSHRGGRLQVRIVGAPSGRDVAYLEQETPDRWRVVEGYEQGERLDVVRDGSGDVVKLMLATYPLTRSPQPFAP
jgi:CubicO group peptidase (beta-lactamase class C family)